MLQAMGKKPLFVQFILDNLWAVYKAVVMERYAMLYRTCPALPCVSAI